MKLLDFFAQIYDPNTAIGKMSIGFDSIGVTMSILLYGFGLKHFINEVFPPVVLVLTVVSLLINIVFKVISSVKELKRKK